MGAVAAAARVGWTTPALFRIGHEVPLVVPGGNAARSVNRHGAIMPTSELHDAGHGVALGALPAGLGLTAAGGRVVQAASVAVWPARRPLYAELAAVGGDASVARPRVTRGNSRWARPGCRTTRLPSRPRWPLNVGALGGPLRAAPAGSSVELIRAESATILGIPLRYPGVGDRASRAVVIHHARRTPRG